MSTANPRQALWSLLASAAIVVALPAVELAPAGDADAQHLHAPPALTGAAVGEQSKTANADVDASGLPAERVDIVPARTLALVVAELPASEPGARSPRYRLAPKTSPPHSA